MSRILIIGDSWGEGEWGHLCANHLIPLPVCKCPYGTETFYGVVHRGLEQHLRDHGCYVENVAWGGTSNLDAAETLYHNRRDSFDHIFWFVTDPLRDVRNNTIFTAYSEQDIKQHISHYMDKALNLANNYGSTCKNGVSIIGGLFQPHPELVAKYENINMGCDNFLKLLGFDIPKGYQGFSEVPTIPNKFLDMSEEAIGYLERTVNTYHDFMANREFYPPCEGHPNRKAHKILADYLIDKFNLTPYMG